MRTCHLAVLLAVLAPTILDAEDAAPGRYAAAVNVAGRQRMLSQRAAKEALQIVLDIDAEKSKADLKASVELFEASLVALEKGDEKLGLAPATAPVAQAIEGARPHWIAYKAALEAALDGKADVEALARTNIEVLTDMQSLVKALQVESKVATGTVWGVVVNLAGRQRMFSQKLTKELYLVALGKDAETHRAALKQTSGLFARTLEGLQGGDAELGLPPCTDSRARGQLGVVGKVWGEFSAIVAKTVAGAAPAPEDLEKASKLNLQLLAEADKAVTIFQELASGN